MLPVLGMPAAGIPAFCTDKDLNDASSGITLAKLAKYHTAVDEMVRAQKNG
jgi:hypothetical protein